MIIIKQMKAIRKVALKLYDKDPAHFAIVIAEIDIKLNELKEQELEFADCDVEEFDVREIA